MEHETSNIAQQYLDLRSREEILERVPVLESVCVSDVGLPFHTTTALLRKNVAYLHQLLPYTEKELSQEFHLGPRTTSEITSCIKIFLGVPLEQVKG